MKITSLIQKSSYFCNLLFAISLLIFILVHDANAQGVAKRVQFAKGRTSTTIKGSVRAGKRDTYTFRAKENQAINVDVKWLGAREGNDEQLSGFIFVHPDGTEEEDPQDSYFVAGSTGDYKVIIRTKSRRSATAYVFKLTVQ